MKKKRSKKENKKLFKASIILNYQERRWHPWAFLEEVPLGEPVPKCLPFSQRRIFDQSGRSRGITWFNETALIRVLMPGKIVSLLKEEVFDE